MLSARVLLVRGPAQRFAATPAVALQRAMSCTPSLVSSSASSSSSWRMGLGNMRTTTNRMALFSTSSTGSKRDQDHEPESSLAMVDELIAENAALKKEIEELKAEAAKPQKGLLGTMKTYGVPFLIYWTSLWAGTGVALYGAFDTGLINGAQAIDFVMSMGLDKFVDPERLDPRYGNLALAVIVNEAIEPVRFAFAVATIPYVKKVFTRKPAIESK